MRKWPFLLLCMLLFCLPAANAEEAIGTLLVPKSTSDATAAEVPVGSLLTPETTESVYVDLTRADKGDAVVLLQQRLAELGYYSGQAHGKYDSQTQKAVKMFEKANGLRNDGAASAEDQAVLYSDTAIAAGAAASPATAEPSATLPPEASEYEPLDYTLYMANPTHYYQKKLWMTGNVQQIKAIDETESIVLLRSGSDYICLSVSPDAAPAEDALITAYAVMEGTVTYTNMLNQPRTVPYGQLQFVNPRQDAAED